MVKKSFGPRYGSKVREKFSSVETKKAYKCPHCHKKSLKRESSGIWKCDKCKMKMAGGAYSP